LTKCNRIIHYSYIVGVTDARQGFLSRAGIAPRPLCRGSYRKADVRRCQHSSKWHSDALLAPPESPDYISLGSCKGRRATVSKVAHFMHQRLYRGASLASWVLWHPGSGAPCGDERNMSTTNARLSSDVLSRPSQNHCAHDQSEDEHF